MKKAIGKIDQTVFNLYAKMLSAKAVREERGDTNFISILIIMGVVIGMATLFMNFKDEIVEEVKGIVDGFTIDKVERTGP